MKCIICPSTSRLPQALAELELVRQLQPKSMETLFALGKLLFRMGNTSLALVRRVPSASARTPHPPPFHSRAQAESRAGLRLAPEQHNQEPHRSPARGGSRALPPSFRCPCDGKPPCHSRLILFSAVSQ